MNKIIALVMMLATVVLISANIVRAQEETPTPTLTPTPAETTPTLTPTPVAPEGAPATGYGTMAR